MKFGCDGTEVADVALSKKKPKEGAKCGARKCKLPPAGEHMLYCTDHGKEYARALTASTNPSARRADRAVDVDQDRSVEEG